MKNPAVLSGILAFVLGSLPLRAQSGGDSWTVMASPVPQAVGAGGAIVAVDSDTLVVAPGAANEPGASLTCLWTYTISTGVWLQHPDASPLTWNSGCMAHLPGSSVVYCMPDGSMPLFFTYDVATGLRTDLEAPPAQPFSEDARGPSSAMAVVGTKVYRIVYHMGTAELRFHVFDPALPEGSRWSRLSNAPAANFIAQGLSMIYPGSGTQLYALTGGSTWGVTMFLRYDFGSGAWISAEASPGLLAPPPAQVDNGALALGPDATLYCFPGGNTKGFLRYSIAGNAWSLLAQAPDTVGPALGAGCNAGAGIAWTGAGIRLYAIRGLLSGGPTTGSNEFWRYEIDAPPSDPAGLAQMQVEGSATIPLGGYVHDPAGVRLRAIVADPNGTPVKLQVEVQQAGTAFIGSPLHTSEGVASGAEASVIVPVALDNRQYHWRARTLDAAGLLKSPWFSYGNNNDNGDHDFRTQLNTVPSAPASMKQVDAIAGSISAGQGVTGPATLRFEATLADADFDTVRIEVEIRRLGRPFLGIATAGGTLTPSGAVVGVTADFAEPGEYRWQARGVDRLNGASAWTSFGSNAEADADFVVTAAIGGSTGNGGCGGSSAGLPGALVLASTAVLALAVRRR